MMRGFTQPISASNPAGEHTPLLLMSLASISLSICINIIFDDHGNEETKQGLKELGEASKDPPTKCCCTSALLYKCARNVLHIRMIQEALKAFRFLKGGYEPPPSMNWLHVSEGASLGAILVCTQRRGCTRTHIGCCISLPHFCLHCACTKHTTRLALWTRVLHPQVCLRLHHRVCCKHSSLPSKCFTAQSRP